jgi:hypothetical protein
MTNKEAKHFIETMRSVESDDNREIVDLEDAIILARDIVPLIDHEIFHGEIYTRDGRLAGVFRSNDYESRWFPGLDLLSVAHIIGEETL